MAITKEVSFKGLAVPNAYIKIMTLVVFKEDEVFNLKVDVGIFVSKLGEFLELKSYNLTYDILSVDNVLMQGYLQLKSMTDYLESIDA